MRNYNRAISAALLSGAICGCSTIDSAAIPVGVGAAISTTTLYQAGDPAPVEETQSNHTQGVTPDAGVTSGIAYFLPRQLAKVTAKRSEISLDGAIKKLGEAELAVSMAKARVEAGRAAILQTEDSLVANEEVVPVRELLLGRLAQQKNDLHEAEGDAAKKAQALSSAKDAVLSAARLPDVEPAPTAEGQKATKQYNVAVGIELLPPTADPAHGYRLNPRHSVFRDDEQKLVVSPSGLLTSVDIIAADRTADALVEIATFVGAIMTGGGKSSVTEKKCVGVPEEMSAVVDFADKLSVDTLNASLNCMGAHLDVQGKSSFPAPRHFNAKPVNGIVYRTPIEVLVAVQKCQTGNCSGENGWFPTQTLALSLPQAGPMSVLPQNAGLFTKTVYGTAFKDGILTNYTSNRPSEVLEVARTPMRILNGVFDGASKIISIRTGQNTARAGEINSQVTLDQARTALLVDALTGRKKLTDQELLTLQSQIALQSGQFTGQTQMSAAQLATMQALLRDQARRDAINLCFGEKVSAGQPIDTCLATP